MDKNVENRNDLFKAGQFTPTYWEISFKGYPNVLMLVTMVYDVKGNTVCSKNKQFVTIYGSPYQTATGVKSKQK